MSVATMHNATMKRCEVSMQTRGGELATRAGCVFTRDKLTTHACEEIYDATFYFSHIRDHNALCFKAQHRSYLRVCVCGRTKFSKTGKINCKRLRFFFFKQVIFSLAFF